MTDIYTVETLNELIKCELESKFPDIIKVKGEITNWKVSRGHAYFSLRDSESLIRCVMWQRDYKRLGLELNEGDKVQLTGRLEVYLKSGNYQFITANVEYEGVGDLHAIFQKLKNDCEKAGYFDPTKKKKLPTYIENVGIITALDGAALQDMMFILKKDFKGNVYVKNAIVQGPNCPDSVSEAIEFFNAVDYPLDVIVVARGGGSLQELMGFSDERVLKAIQQSKICTISAVGHEVDTMLSDLVADVRAPTPSIGAEIIVKQQKWLRDKFVLDKKMADRIRDKIDNLGLKFGQIQSRLVHPIVRIEQKEREMERQLEESRKKVFNKLGSLNNHTEKLKERMKLLNPDNILKKGYCVIMDSEGRVLTSIKQLEKREEKMRLIVKMADGEVGIEL
jgi:exodeoxyribonuclease VII large subunit